MTYLAKLLLRVVLFQEVMVFVNQSEAGAAATTEFGLEPVDSDAVFLGLELLSELLLELGL